MNKFILGFLAGFIGVAGSLAQNQPAGNSGAAGQDGRSTQSGENPRRGDSAYQRAGGSLFQLANSQRAAQQAVGGGGGAGGGATGSAAGDSGNPFAVKPPEPRRIKKFDLVTVIIREESDSKTKNNAELKKNTDFNALLEQYIKFSMADFSIKGKAPLANQPNLKFQMDRNFKGEGTVDRSDSMSARVQAQVIDVKPNGNLVIQATKQIKNDDEEQRFILTGVLRAEDLTVDNSVLSTQLADLMLEKTTKGAARDTAKRGFIPRLLDLLNPF